MIVHSRIKDYSVDISQGFIFLDELNQIPNKIVVVDKKVYDLYKDKVFAAFSPDDIYLIEAVESNKTIESALEICSRMTRLPAKRNATIISFGGGIIQDITGFAASVLYRGTQWVFVPTTLLAQADSCVGSKTSLNYLSYKNLLGTFYPPNRIFVDTGFLFTLSDQDFGSGLGEIVKFNTMNGITHFREFEKVIPSLLARDSGALDFYVRKSLEFKKILIEEDEFDFGPRQLLNYGHTFGHALESITEFKVPHGLAVLLGMRMANIISERRGLIEKKARERIENVINKVLNGEKLGLNKLDLGEMNKALSNDKKKVSKDLSVIMLKDDFKLVKVDDVTEDEVAHALTGLNRILDEE